MKNNYVKILICFILLCFIYIDQEIYCVQNKNESVLSNNVEINTDMNNVLYSIPSIALQASEGQVININKNLQTMEYLIGRYQFNATGAGIHASTIVQGEGRFFTGSSHVAECAAYEKASGEFDGNSSGAYLDSKYNQGGDILKAYLVIEATYLKESKNLSINDFTYTFLHGDGSKITDKIESKLEIVNASTVDNYQRENGFIDVTDFVKKNGYGWYYACNLPWSDKYGIDSYSCWKLIVIERNEDLPIRVLKLDMGNSIIGNDQSKIIEISGENIKTKTSGEVTGQFLFSMNGADMYSQTNTKSGAIYYSGDGTETNLKNIVTKNGTRTLDNPLVSRIMRNGYPINQKINYNNPLYTDGYAASRTPKTNYWLIEGGDLEVIDIDDKTNHDVSIKNGVSKVLFKFQTIGEFVLSTSALGIAVDIDVPEITSNQTTKANTSKSVTVSGKTKNESTIANTGISEGKLIVTLDSELTANTATAVLVDENGQENTLTGIIDNEKHIVIFNDVNLYKKSSYINYSIECIPSDNKTTKFNNKDTYSGNLYTNSTTVDFYIEDITLSKSSAIPYHNLTINPNGGVWEGNTSTINEDMLYNSTKQISNPTRVGYTFNGWSLEGEGSKLDDDIFTMGKEDAIITADWVPNSNVKYVVKHWLQNINGDALRYDDENYSLEESKDFEGTSDENVSPEVNTYVGFTSPNKQTVKVSPDGSTVINYYYTRNKYSVKINKDDGIDSIVGENSYYFEEEVTIDVVVNSNYVWKNWTGYKDISNKEYKFSMPAENIEYNANTIKKSKVIVKYIDINNDEEIIDEIVINGLVNDNYTTEKKVKSGYEFVSVEGNVTGKMEENPITITYKYAKQSNVITKYIDENTGAEIPGVDSVTTTYKEKDSYTTEKKTIDGYTYTRDTENTSGTVERENIEVIYYYKKNTSVTAKYLDKYATSVVLADEVTKAGLEADDYTTEQKTVSGYVYDSVDGEPSGRMQATPTTVTYYYIKQSNVVTKYVDENTGEEISGVDSITTTYKEKDPYTTEKKTIDGYTYTRDTENTSGTVGRDNIEVTYYYKKNTGVTVKYLDKYATDVVLADEVSIPGLEGQDYTTEQKTVSGYVFSNVEGEPNGKMQATPTTVTYYYIKQSDVTTKYVDENTGLEIPVVDSITTTYKEKDPYTTEKKNIEGYTYTKDSNNTSGIVGRDNIEVTYYYKKNTGVTVRYLDKYATDVVLADEVSIPGLEGQDYTTEQKVVTGYIFSDVEGTANGKMPGTSITVTYYYIKQSDVTIKYVDENTGLEIPGVDSIITTYKEKDNYTTEKKTIDGYTYTKDSNNTSGTVARDNIEVTYYYKKNSGVTVKYVDMLDDNKEIVDRAVIPGLENDDYSTEEKEIAGYIFVETEGIVNGKMSQEPTEVIYKYKKASNLITEHIDANTNEKIIEDVIKVYKEGESYEAYAQNLEGYVLVQSPESTTGVMGREDVIKTFYYKKISGGLVVKYVDRITGELLDYKEYEGNENDNITLEEKTFLGYVLDERPNYSNIELGVEGKEVTFYYRKTVEIDVIGIDQETGDEIYSTIVSGVEGDKYTTSEREVEGYVLVKTPGNNTGIFDRSNTNVIYEYRKLGDVTVRYIDIETNEELHSYTINGKSGDNYTTEEKEFENYKLVEVVGEQVGIIKGESTEVIYYYELKIGKVIVRYVDEKGNELLKEELIGKVGSKYQTEIKGIENYEVIEIANNAEGKYIDGTIEVEIKYRKLKGKIVVKFVDRDGNVLSESYVEQDEIEQEFYYELPEIDGYRIVGDKIIKAIFSNGELVFNAEYEKIIDELPDTGDINIVFYVLIATFSIIIITKKII